MHRAVECLLVWVLGTSCGGETGLCQYVYWLCWEWVGQCSWAVNAVFKSVYSTMVSVAGLGCFEC
jgi:hypothetical protein